jgi:hypothetical protein
MNGIRKATNLPGKSEPQSKVNGKPSGSREHPDLDRPDKVSEMLLPVGITPARKKVKNTNPTRQRGFPSIPLAGASG